MISYYGILGKTVQWESKQTDTMVVYKESCDGILKGETHSTSFNTFRTWRYTSRIKRCHWRTRRGCTEKGYTPSRGQGGERDVYTGFKTKSQNRRGLEGGGGGWETSFMHPSRGQGGEVEGREIYTGFCFDQNNFSHNFQLIVTKFHAVLEQLKISILMLILSEIYEIKENNSFWSKNVKKTTTTTI